MKNVLSKKISVSVNDINSNIKNTLYTIVNNRYSGICITDGYVKPNSIKLISYSSGLVISSDISFTVIFECYICNPVEGMVINCIIRNITKAGIRAESNEYTPTPFVIFVARDHNFNNTNFSSLTEGQEISVRVIGQRFELNDKFISIIAEFINNKPVISNNNTNHNKTKKTKNDRKYI
jgi:DNA-directed RNA polymerase subunit E'/Rpb7